MWYLCRCGMSKNAPNYRSNISKPFVCERCKRRGVRLPLLKGEKVDSQVKIRVRSLFAKANAHVVKR